jgi:hypothetical protein
MKKNLVNFSGVGARHHSIGKEGKFERYERQSLRSIEKFTAIRLRNSIV